MDYRKKIILLVSCMMTSTAWADAGDVKFINHSTETFTLAPNEQAAAQLIGLPLTIASNTEKNYFVTLLDSNASSQFDYSNANNQLHFSITVKSAKTFIDHHTTEQNVDYLSVNWENVLQHSDIHYVLPLYWNDPSYLHHQQVRVDSDNNALIGIFTQEPNNAITVMSYNTDKDGTGTDHNPQLRHTSDILNLFTSGQLPTPDVLMIQEGLGLNDLSRYQQTLSQLAPGNWFGFYKTEGNRLDSNIILINPKFPAKDIQSGGFSFTEQCGWGLVGKRNADYADIPMSDVLGINTPGNLRIFDTHLESGSGSDIFFHAAQVRLAQFNEILNYPRTNVSELVVGGDFNTMPFFDDLTGLTKYQQGDLTSVFDKYMGDPTVNWGQPITCTWSTCSQYTFKVGMWLDRLFTAPIVTPGYKTYVLYPFVAHQVDGYSDHLPVWFTLYIDKK